MKIHGDYHAYVIGVGMEIFQYAGTDMNEYESDLLNLMLEYFNLEMKSSVYW